MSNSFVCAQCGVTHEGLLTDYAWKLPDDVWAIPEAKRSDRATWDSDLCNMGDRFFIRCVLRVPFTEREGDFGWGVWVEVDEEDFLRYVELYAVDGSSEPHKRGKLANLIPGYEDARSEPVSIQFAGATARPEVMTGKDSESSLAHDQRRGMDDARYHDILVANGALNA